MAFTKNQQVVAEYYIASLGRSPESAGLDYWVGRLEGTIDGESQLTANEVRDFFLNRSIDEVAARFPVGQDAAATVGNIYQNVFGRTADEGGLAYWMERLEGVNDAGQPQLTENELISEMLTAAKAPENEIDGAFLVAQMDDAWVVYNSTSAEDGQTFVLEPNIDGKTDSVIGTAGDDVYDATAIDSLDADDVISDPSVEDNDVLTANMKTGLTADTIIINVENITLKDDGGIATHDVSGINNTKNLNIDHKDKVLFNSANDSASLIIDNVNGNKIENVIMVDRTKSLAITDADNGVNVILKADATALALEANDTTSGDASAVTVELKGASINFTQAEDADATDETLEKVTMTSSDAASVITLNTTTDLAGDTALTAMATELDLAGDQDITIKGSEIELLAAKIRTDLTDDATSTIDLTYTTTAALVLDDAEVDLVKVDASGIAAASSVKVDENSAVEINKINATPANTFSVLGDSATDSLEVHLATGNDGAATGVLILGSGADADDAAITVDSDSILGVLDMSNLTNATSTLDGAGNLTIGTLTMGAAGPQGAGGSLDGSAMTGDLKVTLDSGVTTGVQVISGSGNDTIKGVSGTDLDAGDNIATGAGDDVIEIAAGALAAEIIGGEGKDTFVMQSTESTQVLSTDTGNIASNARTGDVTSNLQIEDFTAGSGGDQLSFDMWADGSATNTNATLATTLYNNGEIISSSSADLAVLADQGVALISTTDIKDFDEADAKALIVVDATAPATSVFANPDGSAEQTEYIFIVGETSGVNGVKVFYINDITDATTVTESAVLIGVLDNINISGFTNDNFDF